MDTAAGCIELLQERLHVTCSLDMDTSRLIYGDDRLANFDVMQADAIVAIGGDGAVLRAAQLALETGKPLFGINSGRVGHLCCMQLDDLKTLTEEQFAKFRLSNRTLLSVQVGEETHIALNDVIISKAHFGETLELSLEVDGESIAHFRGDGLIVSTPTGSTAYNASAGGPVVDADVPAVVLTAICPHNQKVTPRVVCDTAQICVHIVRATNGSAQVFADGVHLGNTADDVKICCSEKKLVLYCR